MCQATVYLERDGEQELIMNDVFKLWIEGDTVWVSRLFEEPVPVRAEVKQADFLEHAVILVALEHESAGET